MAIDKAVDSGQLDAGLTTVADAIRAKGGTAAQLSFPNGMAAAIAAIHTGITPTGNINITTMNSTDVTNYATAKVVDADIVAGNIKSGVNILGVTGSYAGKAVQNDNRWGTSTSTSYAALTQPTITVAKTGTYNVYWVAVRGYGTSSTAFGTQLYRNNTSSGSAQTSFTKLAEDSYYDQSQCYAQQVARTNVALTAGDKLTIRAKCASGAFTCAGALTIVEV